MTAEAFKRNLDSWLKLIHDETQTDEKSEGREEQ